MCTWLDKEKMKWHQSSDLDSGVRTANFYNAQKNTHNYLVYLCLLALFHTISFF